MILFLLVSCSTTVNKERFRDSKLMPIDIAQNIVDEAFGMKNTDRFILIPNGKMALDFITYSFCKHQEKKEFFFNEVEVSSWGNSFNPILKVSSIKKYEEISFPCSEPFTTYYKRYQGIFKLKDEDQMNDVIDALVSLGIKIKVE